MKMYEQMEVQIPAYSAQIWMEVSSLFHSLIYHWGKSLWYTLDRKLDGVYYEEEKTS
jgi:hypothetical protein